MMSQYHLSDLLRSRALVRDLTASMVGLVLGVVLSSLLAFGVTTGADLPGGSPTAQVSPGQVDAAVGDRIAELEASNARLAAGLVRLSGAERSVLPPPEIAGPENPLSWSTPGPDTTSEAVNGALEYRTAVDARDVVEHR